MISLSTQLKNDYIALFENDSEYSNIVVKENYEKYPKISYPIITIQELNNEDVNQYFDGDEQVSYLSYQIEIRADQNENHTALENVQLIGEKIDEYMKGARYKCMRRIGNFIKAPMKSDNNIIVGYLRYECYVELKTNTIYRRY